MTVISNQEEEIAKSLLNGGEMKFYPQTALQATGGDFFSNETPDENHFALFRETLRARRLTGRAYERIAFQCGKHGPCRRSDMGKTEILEVIGRRVRPNLQAGR